MAYDIAVHVSALEQPSGDVISNSLLRLDRAQHHSGNHGSQIIISLDQGYRGMSDHQRDLPRRLSLQLPIHIFIN